MSAAKNAFSARQGKIPRVALAHTYLGSAFGKREGMHHISRSLSSANYVLPHFTQAVHGDDDID